MIAFVKQLGNKDKEKKKRKSLYNRNFIARTHILEYYPMIKKVIIKQSQSRVATLFYSFFFRRNISKEKQ
jgi:hypothetical protein